MHYNPHVTLCALLLILGSQRIWAQQISIEQVDQVLTVERAAGNTAIAVKEQKISALMKQLEEAQKQIAACKAAAKEKIWSP